MSSMIIGWSVFAILIISVLIVDLGVLNRKAHEMKMKEALLWSMVWISLALLFNLGVYFWLGLEKALLFLTSYLIEESLSVDNLFVFLLLFSYFQIPHQYRHKVLFWGILGAVVMRAIFIAAGVTLIHKFHWLIYLFGAFLIYTGLKILRDKEKQVEPEKNLIFRILKRFLPLTDKYHEEKFFIRSGKAYLATPLFILLLLVESTDILFALDSIPAVLAITTDPFIVYTSNIFAILGLRSLFFVLAGFLQVFQYLNYGLCIILVFIGAKMLLSDMYKIPIAWALGFIALVLTVAVLASIFLKPKRSVS